MKRCPECDSSFPDTDQFCELDGTQLVSDYSDSSGLSVPFEDPVPEPVNPRGVVGASGYQHSRDAQLPQNWKILAIVAVAGVAIGIVLFIVYWRITREAPGPSADASKEAITQPQIPLLPSQPPPFASASPLAEPSPSPSAMQSPAAQADPARASLSSSPISTGGNEKNKRGPVTIRLTNGTSVEADEVWETGEGIWYRRRGLVTLLERNEVKAIDKAPTATPSPAATPGASQSTSP
ncbi:MAG: hypothetical protein M3410_13965 [Acidobacteriota bacterium]|nr:hypothetical protein [Acidobacteriota bacterium]